MQNGGGQDYQFTEYRHDFRGSMTDRRDTLGRKKSRINGEGETEYSLDYDAVGRVTAVQTEKEIP